MTPQFVDHDADGYLDILVGTYDGSPHLAPGSAEGFLEPRHLLDADGNRILFSMYWDYEKRAWKDGRSVVGYGGHLTSATDFDWDADGDLDLVLADYKEGSMYLLRNEGSASEPSYPGPGEPVEVDGQALRLARGISSVHFADWDGDGLTDLLLGEYGNFGAAGVRWFRNLGAPGDPDFTSSGYLVGVSALDASEPLRPDEGLHVDTTDWDGDGRLDLLVGGYSRWQPPAPALSEADVQRADELQARVDAQALAEQELRGKAGWREAHDALEALRVELDAYRPRAKRVGFVWIYPRAPRGS